MTQLGSEQNPFDNVDAAFEYIIALEQYRLAVDIGMQRYKEASLMVDMRMHPVLSWCQPDTAFQAIDCPADAFIVTKQASGMFQFKPNLANRKFLYRGQTQHYPICVPGLFRDPNQTYFLSEMILMHEMWRLIDSHPLVQLLGQHGVNLNGHTFKMFTNYGGISQHYFCRTRFLDLTSNVDAAKFFATCDYNKDSDSYTPHTENGIGVIYFYELVMPLAFQKMPPGNIEPYYHLSTIGKQIFPRSGAQHGYLFDMSKGIDFEKIGYTSAVYFRHDPTVSKRIFAESKAGLKYMPPSILDRYWREKMASSKT
ncbi:MAG: FRG domain-containing protein, partial [Muribaculaceae bacterium]|nr:FRG domain-containing protein [Muribaculaceae bacterium]